MDNEESNLSPTSQQESSMELDMETSSNENNNNIILPNNTELDWAQILYALHYKRLLFINDYRTWSQFHIHNLEYAHKYNDCSPEELSQRFLHQVLPNIFQYDLNQEELHLLNLLEFHPDFQRTERGFNKLETRQNLEFPIKESITETMQQNGSLQELNFITKNVTANKQIIVTGCGEEITTVLCNFNFNKENAALISVVLSSDDDLAKCELLTVEEMSKRFKKAKKVFESRGEQLENVNISIENLLKKLETLKKLKKVVAEVVNKRFSK